MNNPIIELSNLCKKYAKKTVVDQLNLQIYEGEIFGLLGPNGAGKTTTILMMMGLTEPTAGKTLICGLEANQNPIAVKKIIGYLPDSVGFYDDMTAMENLRFIGSLNGLSAGELNAKAEGLLEQVGLSPRKDKKVGTFSRGMKQRLGLAEVLVKEPKIIILDEPTLGLDPQGTQEFLSLIKDLSRNQKLTVLLSSHHLHHVQQVCDRIGIFVEGKLQVSGKINELALALNEKEGFQTIIQLEGSNVDREQIKQILGEIPRSGISWNAANELILNTQADYTAQIVKLLACHDFQVVSVQRNNNSLEQVYQRYILKNSTIA
jgi:ABC-2 type transport system ATP-binding protein